MSPSPVILLTNDDGVHARGLAALAEAVAPLGTLAIIAPDAERSAVGHGVSVRREMAYARTQIADGIEAHALGGTPADCVKLAVAGIVCPKPDLVVSGINAGVNLGHNVHYSGTVAGAREAAMAGIPAIALSVGFNIGGDPIRFDTAARFGRHLVAQVLERGLPKGILINANVPNLAWDAIQGVTVSHQGTNRYADRMEPVVRDGETTAFINTGDESLRSPEGDALDDRVLAEGRISVTPMHFDLTSADLCDTLSAWDWNGA